MVLAIQDTTDLSYATRPGASGLGFTNQSNNLGIKVHNCFAVSGEGEPLGMLHQYCWSRKKRSGKKQARHKTPIAKKESYRWLVGVKAAEAALPSIVQTVHVGDREADIFELFAQPRTANSELLIRAEHNRKVQHELGHLVPAVEQAPVLGEFTLEVHRNPKRKGRIAQLQVRAMEVTLEVPSKHPKSSGLAPVTLNAILVDEPIPL